MSKLIFSVGYNSKRKYKTRVDRKYTKAHATWRGMLERCYSSKYHDVQPTYIGCTVSDEWLDYQNFAEWFYNHEYSDLDYHLDKDLLITGNKVYSSETCCFVPRQLNSILNNKSRVRGKYPQGVYLHKQIGRYNAKVSIDGKQKCLGYFDCPDDAYQVYKIAKERYVKEKALEWRDRISDDVFQALTNWKLQ